MLRKAYEMPPKIKTTQEVIVNAAFEVARREGVSGITAKSVSKELGTSVAPIFRVFATVDEFRAAALQKASDYGMQYLKNYETQYDYSLTYGLAYINFAHKEAQLFDALSKSGIYNLINVRKMMREELSFVIMNMAKSYKISEKNAEEFFCNYWVYAHGLASISSKVDAEFNLDEAAILLQAVFDAFLKHYQ